MQHNDPRRGGMENGRRTGRKAASRRHLRLVTTGQEIGASSAPRPGASDHVVSGTTASRHVAPGRITSWHVVPPTAQVVDLRAAAASRAQRGRRQLRSRVFAALCLAVGLSQVVAWSMLPHWWCTPIAGSLAPAHAALIAGAVMLLCLALTYVISLGSRSAGGSRQDADHERVLSLSTVF